MMLERLARLIESRLRGYFDRRFDELKQEIKMSGTTLADQMTAGIATIKGDVAAVSAEVTKLLAGMTPGTQITQQMVDDLTAIDLSLKAIPPAP